MITEWNRTVVVSKVAAEGARSPVGPLTPTQTCGPPSSAWGLAPGLGEAVGTAPCRPLAGFRASCQGVLVTPGLGDRALD